MVLWCIKGAQQDNYGYHFSSLLTSLKFYGLVFQCKQTVSACVLIITAIIIITNIYIFQSILHLLSHQIFTALIVPVTNTAKTVSSQDQQHRSQDSASLQWTSTYHLASSSYVSLTSIAPAIFKKNLSKIYIMHSIKVIPNHLPPV